MSIDIPRVVVIDSKSVAGTSFVTGFVRMTDGNSSTINPGTFYPAQDGNPPYILYTENQKIKTDDVGPRLLPPYTFSGKNSRPKEVDVSFDNKSGEQYGKIKVVSTQGHPDDDVEDVYNPHNLIVWDRRSEETSEAAAVMGFMIDLYEGDQLVTESLTWDGIAVISVDSSKQVSKNWDTHLYLFPIDKQIISYTLDLKAQNMESKIISYSKTTPDRYDPINE
ncbi:MAG: hypothetical protein QM737_12960 [Ferruginibacter sp.]